MGVRTFRDNGEGRVNIKSVLQRDIMQSAQIEQKAGKHQKDDLCKKKKNKDRKLIDDLVCLSEQIENLKNI